MASGTPRGTRRQPARKQLNTAFRRQGIVVPRPAAVVAYLNSHVDLARLVPAVCEEARKEFGTDAELTLLVYCDPEIDDKHLSLYVRLWSYDETILPRMDRVTQKFDKQLSSASGYLVITTDLRLPRA